jgi:hypothetical protein
MLDCDAIMELHGGSVQPIQGRPSGEIPVFSNDEGDRVVDARNPDSVLFKVTDIGVAEVREAPRNVGSGLIDVRSLVGESDAVEVAPTGTLVSEVQARVSTESDEVATAPSRWIWWVMGILLVAVVAMAAKVLGLV